MDCIDDLIAKRIGGKDFFNSTQTFKFEKIKIAKREAIKKHPSTLLMDMGVGEPDYAADEGILQKLSEEASKTANRFYSDNGILEFQQAACDYLKKVYSVESLDPVKNILHGIGSKPILAMLPLCFINPGDIALVTHPGYPILGTYTNYLGGEVYPLALREENNFLPDLNTIPAHILKKAKLLYINYPNNPTGATATKAFFEEIITFAKANNIIVVHDAAYAAITFDGNKPLSFLSIDGAKEVGVEIHSMSKAFNMTGWRLAFIAGNEKVIKAYAEIKNNTDSGQFMAIQKAGAYALEHTEITRKTCQRYSKRFNLLVTALNEIGFQAKKPSGSFYCYVKAPKGAGVTLFSSAEDAAEYLITQALISTVAWDEEGAYLRFSVTFDTNGSTDEMFIQQLKERLKNLDLKF